MEDTAGNNFSMCVCDITFVLAKKTLRIFFCPVLWCKALLKMSIVFFLAQSPHNKSTLSVFEKNIKSNVSYYI